MCLKRGRHPAIYSLSVSCCLKYQCMLDLQVTNLREHNKVLTYVQGSSWQMVLPHHCAAVLLYSHPNMPA